MTVSALPIAASASASASSVAAKISAVAALPASASASSPDLALLIKPFTPDAIANGVATLIGALIGAMLAYLLQRRFQKAHEHRSAHAAAHRLMFVLLQQINTIVLIQRDYVYEHLSNPGRFLSIPPTPPYDTSKNILELPELSFLIENRQGRAILYEFYMAQENYVEAIRQWNIRSALHVERVQPALAASNIPNGGEITEGALQLVLGKHIFGAMLTSTNNCIESLQRAFQKLAVVKVKARSYVVARFKSKDFTDFEFLETYGLSIGGKSEAQRET